MTSGGEKEIDDENIKSSYFILPAMYAAGLSLKYNDNMTFAADYQRQNWGSTSYTGLGYTLVNSDRYSAGIEFSQKTNTRDFFYEKYNLQAGVFYKNSYLYINGVQLPDYGLCAGYGFSAKTGTLNY